MLTAEEDLSQGVLGRGVFEQLPAQQLLGVLALARLFPQAAREEVLQGPAVSLAYSEKLESRVGGGPLTISNKTLVFWKFL